MARPIQIPGIWNSFKVIAKIMLVAKMPKSTRVNFVSKFVLVISWEVRIGSIEKNKVCLDYSIVYFSLAFIP